MRSRSTLWAGISTILLLSPLGANASEGSRGRYDPDAYPKLDCWIPFFSERLKSPRDRVRRGLGNEVLTHLPHPEAERLMFELLDDSDEKIRLATARGLLKRGYTVPRASLALGLWARDPSKPGALEEMLAEARGERRRWDRHGGEHRCGITCYEAGRAALVLAVFGDAADIPRIRPLLQHPNSRIAFGAATAFAILGESPEARDAFHRVSFYTNESDATTARWAALAEARLVDGEASLANLASQLRRLKQSDRLGREYNEALRALADATGQWHNNVGAWQQWEWARRGKGAIPSPSARERALRKQALLYPHLICRIPYFEARFASDESRVRYVLRAEVSQLLPHDEASRVMAIFLTEKYNAGQTALSLVTDGRPEVAARALRHADALGKLEGAERAAALAKIRATLDVADLHPEKGRTDIGRDLWRLGLYGDKSDVPRLRRLLGHDSLYIRSQSASALLQRGRKKLALAALRRIARVPVTPAPHGELGDTQLSAALLAYHHGDESGLGLAVATLAAMEPSTEYNMARRYDAALLRLANLMGVWHDDAASWARWLDARAKAR